MRRVGFTLLLGGMLSLSLGQRAEAAQITLAWSAPTMNQDGTPLDDLAGYTIYTGTKHNRYTEVRDVGLVTTYTVRGLQKGKRYYFRATAYDTGGLESRKSNEVSGRAQ